MCRDIRFSRSRIFRGFDSSVQNRGMHVRLLINLRAAYTTSCDTSYCSRRYIATHPCSHMRVCSRVKSRCKRHSFALLANEFAIGPAIERDDRNKCNRTLCVPLNRARIARNARNRYFAYNRARRSRTSDIGQGIGHSQPDITLS